MLAISLKLCSITKFISKTFQRKNATVVRSELRTILEGIIPVYKEKVKELRKNHGSKRVCEVTVDMLCNGMCGLQGLVYEPSVLDPQEGIRFRGLTIKDCQNLLPKAPGGDQPLPEGLFWLLLTGRIPTGDQVRGLSKELAERATIPAHVASLLHKMPSNLNPMSQLSCAITVLNTESQFSKSYAEGKLKKASYWVPVFEDSLNLIAKLPVIAATIYRNTYRDGKICKTIDTTRDWSGNFACMLGFDDEKFAELLRMYLMIHSDHEGGSVCAHAVHLVGSALSDPYLAFAAGINGLAGPLHGLKNQAALLFVTRVRADLGDDPSDATMREYVREKLEAGETIPGYGHSILECIDPRYICQREFALKNLPNDPLFRLATVMCRVVPSMLRVQADPGSKVNVKCWPTVDAQSGILLHHYGLQEIGFYGALYGVARSLGSLASLIWDRALELPIERPKSTSFDKLMESVQNK